jgi:outer membrane protein OmpA-like peptidoglycan-associated protein
MRRVWLAVVLAALPTVASAEPTQLGGFFGPRIFSDDAWLGYNEDEPAHPTLHNGVGFGARVAKPFGFPWLVPELELVVVPTKTFRTCVGMSCAEPTSVVWMEPRFHLRFDLLPQRKVEPFVMIGGGAPIAFSSARKTFNSGISGEGYVGAGVRFNTQKGFVLRMDARFAMLPAAEEKLLTYEGDVTLGIELDLGAKRPRRTTEVIVAAPPPDKDGDGIVDANDKCPGRPEDTDGFEDADGCPDIDNDNDRVLDIADKCPTEMETLNGYMDDDGCSDSLPPEIGDLRGTIEGLIYADGETVVHDSAQKSLQNIATLMIDHPSIKIILVGHTDDREAAAFAEKPAEGQPPPDIASIATDLSRARAEAVRQALVTLGVPSGRMVVDGVGAEEPVTDNSTPKGRLANRRVELKLFVPK